MVEIERGISRPVGFLVFRADEEAVGLPVAGVRRGRRSSSIEAAIARSIEFRDETTRSQGLGRRFRGREADRHANEPRLRRPRKKSGSSAGTH